MAKLLPVLQTRYFSDDGLPLAGCKLYSYIAGTSTPLTTYTDEAGTVPNANPVVFDANGAANVWLGNRFYKFILTDAADVVQFTVDNVDGGDSGAGSSTWAEHDVVDGQAAANLVGETVDLDDNSQAIYEAAIMRGTTVISYGTLLIQDLNGTGRLVLGAFIADEPHGVTFSISQAAAVVQLKAALDPGAGDGVIKLARRLVPA